MFWQLLSQRDPIISRSKVRSWHFVNTKCLNIYISTYSSSQVMVSYGHHVLSSTMVPDGNIYQEKYKGISVCFSIFRYPLTGEYVNFGVFKLYGDTAFEDAFSTFIKLTLYIPLDHLNTYPKLAKAYYYVLKPLAKDHTTYLFKSGCEVFQ